MPLLVQGSGMIRGVSISDVYKTVLCIGKKDEAGKSAKGLRGLVWGLRLTGMRLTQCFCSQLLVWGLLTRPGCGALSSGNEPEPRGHSLAGLPVAWIQKTPRSEVILWSSVFSSSFERCPQGRPLTGTCCCSLAAHLAVPFLRQE